MKFKFLFAIALAGTFFAAAPAQEISTPLATMEGRSFTVQDLQQNVSDAWLKLPETLAKARTDLLELQIDELLLKQEAGKRGMSVESLLEAEVKNKVNDPDEKSVKAVYDENKASLGTVQLSEVRPQIIKYLRVELEENAQKEFTARLKKAAKIEQVKDVNAGRPVSKDVLALVNGQSITYSEFVDKNGLALYEYEANVFEQVDTALKLIVDAAVYHLEAEARGIAVNELIKLEITDKMKDFSGEEQQRLEGGLNDVLYKKYRVKFFLTEPQPFVQNISADDDPFSGKANAAVTIIMFADYECPACAGVHPLIKNLAAKYGDRVRIVYRDFPLSDMHEFAFNAALAANAARKQGKFFEYTELLYQNQDDLDPAALKKYASDLKLNLEQFIADMESPEASEEIRKDIRDGRSYGVTGTPSIFVNGYKVRTLSLKAFQDAIERGLAGTYQVTR